MILKPSLNSKNIGFQNYKTKNPLFLVLSVSIIKKVNNDYLVNKSSLKSGL